jgi:hypothetical protein
VELSRWKHFRHDHPIDTSSFASPSNLAKFSISQIRHPKVNDTSFFVMLDPTVGTENPMRQGRKTVPVRGDVEGCPSGRSGGIYVCLLESDDFADLVEFSADKRFSWIVVAVVFGEDI